LSDQEGQDSQFFIWAGCCMHKEMNSLKGGACTMAEFWGKADLIGPLKLMNKDNAAAINEGPSAAHDHALDVYQLVAEFI
ncbi:hypothetical protein L208DRAFT_1277192, partial [Tricholoma matsutake]